MSMIPFIAWGATIVAGIAIYLWVATQIEKSGLKRLGATGNLFTCDPDKAEKK